MREEPPSEVGREKVLGARSKMLRKGCQAWLEFLEFARHRYGNTARAWFRMDAQEKLVLTEKEFVRGCDEIGFRGNIPALWRYVDADRGGHVRLWELDPRAGVILASFRKFLLDRTTDASGGFRLLDANNSNRVYKAEFTQRLRELGHTTNLSQLFDLLDRDGYGFLVEHNLGFLHRWKPHPYLFCKPNFDAVQPFKDALLARDGPPLAKVWRKVLDREGTMRVKWSSFVTICSQSSMLKQNGAPKTEEQMCAVWKAFDADSSGWISLREFDSECFEIYAGFKRWAEEAHGTVINAFREIDASTNGNGKLAPSELRKVLTHGPKAWVGNPDWLFECLDWNETGRLVEQDFFFLDHWDLDGEDWEATVRNWHSRPKPGVRPKVGPEAGQVSVVVAPAKP